ncbi:MAG: hypothetical protein NTZ05_16035 [Chloroflexi bacterium]|nr:hypothetical protein [Chloroflexota bacterium]
MLEALARIGLLRAVAVPQAPPGSYISAPSPAFEFPGIRSLVPTIELYLLLGFYLGAVSFGEWLTAAVDPKIGVPFHAAIMVLISSCTRR